MDLDFSSFKAQIKALEPKTPPEIIPVTTVTSQAINKNFTRIQEVIVVLLVSH